MIRVLRAVQVWTLVEPDTEGHSANKALVSVRVRSELAADKTAQFLDVQVRRTER